MDIKYNEPIEVTKDEYSKLMHTFAGIIAGKEAENKEETKYYIKCWLMKYSSYLSEFITKLRVI